MLKQIHVGWSVCQSVARKFGCATGRAPCLGPWGSPGWRPLPGGGACRGNIDMRLNDYESALADFSTAADLAPGLAGAAQAVARVAMSAHPG